MKNSNDTTWNRNRVLPACSAVPQATAPQRAPVNNYRVADKSLARPLKETSYSDQDLQNYTKTYNTIPRTTTLYQDLQHYTKTYNTTPRLTTLYQDLQHYTKTYNTTPRLTTLHQDLRRTNNSNIFLFVRHKSWYSVVSLGRCSLFLSRVGLRTYQLPGISYQT